MPPQNPIRVAIIGHTGRGNYGHGLDVVWMEVAPCQVVAVADADEQGRQEAAQRLGNCRAYANYVDMLDREKPDIVSIGPRWVDQHHAMVLAAAQRGIHIYMEKPLCRTLVEADEMVEVCEQHHVKLAIAFQTRYSPVLQVIRAMIENGDVGDVLELRGRGKEDHRGGGEDFHVLGCHIFNLMHLLGGDPVWCFAEALQQGTRVNRSHVSDGPEGLGPLAADQMHSQYGMHEGVTGYFATHRDAQPASGTRYGLEVVGSRGLVQVGMGYLPSAFYLPDPLWSPGKSGIAWQPISSQGPGKPEPLAGQTNHHGNIVACHDLLAAIAEDRQPEASIYDARMTLEMTAAAFESHRLNMPVRFPLTTRENPLTLLPPMEPGR